jgi:hypothetical protein
MYVFTMLYLQIINVHRRTPILLQGNIGDVVGLNPCAVTCKMPCICFGIRGKPNYATTTLRHVAQNREARRSVPRRAMNFGSDVSSRGLFYTNVIHAKQILQEWRSPTRRRR